MVGYEGVDVVLRVLFPTTNQTLHSFSLLRVGTQHGMEVHGGTTARSRAEAGFSGQLTGME